MKIASELEGVDSIYDLAIIGLGPAGLIAAINAAKLGLKVCAFENRELYTRGQRVGTNPSVFDFLSQLRSKPADENDITFDQTKKSKIKDIERYMFAKLSAFPNVTIIREDGLQLQVLPYQPNPCVAAGESRYYFHNLCDASGIHHCAVSEIEKNFNISIQYERQLVKDSLDDCLLSGNVTNGELYKKTYSRKERESLVLQAKKRFLLTPQYHFSAQIKIKNHSNDTKTMSQGEQQERLIQLGWKSTSIPRLVIAGAGVKNKFSIAGQLSNDIFIEPDVSKKFHMLQEWARILFVIQRPDFDFNDVQINWSKSTNELKAFKKNQMALLAFEMTPGINYIQNPIIKLPGGQNCYVIGDAGKQADYRFGTGLGSALEQAMAIGTSIVKNDLAIFYAAVNNERRGVMEGSVFLNDPIKGWYTNPELGQVDEYGVWSNSGAPYGHPSVLMYIPSASYGKQLKNDEIQSNTGEKINSFIECKNSVFSTKQEPDDIENNDVEAVKTPK